MNVLEALEVQRAAAKLLFEAHYRDGDYESEAWAMHELMSLDERIEKAKTVDSLNGFPLGLESSVTK